MHNPFDHLAKKVGKGALDASGPTVLQYEISRDAQHADIRHDPDPTRHAERARLGLLGRLAEVLCLIEIYGHAPEARELRACISKHFAHWEECAAKERVHNRERKRKGLPPGPSVAPFLWIIVASVSAPMMRELGVVAAPGWPKGVYFHGGDVFRVGIVVANELPRDRSTLLVRIMAAGPRARACDRGSGRAARGRARAFRGGRHSATLARTARKAAEPDPRGRGVHRGHAQHVGEGAADRAR